MAAFLVIMPQSLRRLTVTRLSVVRQACVQTRRPRPTFGALDPTFNVRTMRMEDMVKAPALATDELTRRLSAEFPEVWKAASGLAIEEVWWGGCRLRQAFRAQSLRPGATISGATIMALGDYAVYVALLASIGWEPLAVTTSLNINFLRKPGH